MLYFNGQLNGHMDKATLILRKMHQLGVSQVIPSGQQWKPVKKNGHKSLQIAAASQDLIQIARTPTVYTMPLCI